MGIFTKSKNKINVKIKFKPMKKIAIIVLVTLIWLPATSQRLKVDTYTRQSSNYKKHYSHIIDGVYVNDSTHIFIGGNINDKPVNSDFLSGHKIYATGVTLIKNKRIDPEGDYDNIHLTDFTVHPATNFQYGAGTGIYYPDGVDGDGYPFLGIYDKETLQVDSFVYYNISYPGADTAHAIGLRLLYSSREEAYYICGLMCNKKFDDIDIYNINARTKGFILKTDADDQSTDDLLVFSPDSVNSNAWLCMISDIEFAPGERRIAFTGLNTIDDFTGYRHPMAGMLDVDLDLKWCYSYEIEDTKYAGIDVEFNTDDTTLLVLMNSTTTEFAIMELNKNGILLQGPEAYKFTDTSTDHDTTRAHHMHYHNDTVIITGNHFADVIEDSDTNYKQFLFRFDLNADSLGEELSDLSYYSKQVVPPGEQVPVYSYWAPENSLYLDDSLYLVGVLNETSYTGFTFVRVNGIDPDCVDTLSILANEPQLDDTISCIGVADTCSSTEVDITLTNMNPSNYSQCFQTESAVMSINDIMNEQNLWELKQINNDGVEIVITSDKSSAYHINVYDMLGREVYSAGFNVNKGKTDIKLSFEVKPEIYLIRLSNGEYDETRKIINNHLR